MNNLKFMVGNGDTTYDYTPLVEKIVWSGRKGAAPRSITVTLFDSEGFNLTRAHIDVENGQTCVLYEGGTELFRGLLMTENKSSNRRLTLKAWDNAIYLANSKNSFSYKNKTASMIFKDCCKKTRLSVGSSINTYKKLSEISKSSTTYWDVIQQALEETYKRTGRRYYVSSEKGKMYLRQRKNEDTMLTIDLATNTESYEQERSISDTRTRIKLVTSKNKTKKSWVNKSLEHKIGKFSEVEQVDKDVTKTELKQKIETFKKEKSIVSKTLSWTGTGNSKIIAGGCVFAKLDALGLNQVMYVEEDTHTFSDGKHQMKLKLSYYPDFDKTSEASKTSYITTWKVISKSGVQIKSSPKGKVIKTVHYGRKVKSDGVTSGGMLRVTYGGKTGYCYKKYLKKE